MDPIAEERFVALIDDAIAEIARSESVPIVVDALLDLRLRVLESVVLDWVEREVHDSRSARARRPGSLSSLMHRSI